MKIIQMLRGTFAKKPELADGQMYLAKDTKQVFIGDKAITEGEIELAEKSYVQEVKDTALKTEQELARTKAKVANLTTEVNDQASDIADIQADYAQTTGGNTVTANGVVISDENGKLKSVTGSNGQIVKIDANGKPSVEDAGYLPLSGGTMTGDIIANKDKEFNLYKVNGPFLKFNAGLVGMKMGKQISNSGATLTINSFSSLFESYFNKQYKRFSVNDSGIYAYESENSGANYTPFLATEDGHIATKKYVDTTTGNYLPLSGGEMTGDIKVSAQTSGFQISKVTETLSFNMGVNTAAAGLWSTMNGQEANASISVNQTDQSDATIQLTQQLSASEGVNIIISNNEAKIYNLSETSSESTYFPSSDASLVNKLYVDGSVASIPVTNITVSSTQPTTQKSGDFWYQVTGTF